MTERRGPSRRLPPVRSLRRRWPAAIVSLGAVTLGCGGPSGPVETSARATPVASDSYPPAEQQLRAERPPPPQGGQRSELLGMLAEQLRRSFSSLAQQAEPAHFLAYQVTEQESYEISASHGALVRSERGQSRVLDIDLRVGSAAADDTRRIPGEPFVSTYHGQTALPLTGSGPAVVNTVWLATNKQYESARQRWQRVRAENERSDDTRVEAPSFSPQGPVVAFLPRVEHELDAPRWEKLLARVSDTWSEYPQLVSSVDLSVQSQNRSYVNSDGTELQTGEHRVRLSFTVSTISEDGMPLTRYEAIDVRSVDDLPSERELKSRFARVFEDVRALSRAPLIEPYAGPAILDGRAAGVFFHEIFGHRIEGHRQDDVSEGQTFSALVGQQIVSDVLDIFDDPSLYRLNGVELNGHYFFDDEGVAARRAPLIEDGVLRGFLMSRTPTRRFLESNGHGRRQTGHRPVSRQANLVVEPNRAVSFSTLRRALLDEVKRQGLPYGLRFSEITGGYTQTQRYESQAFKVVPVMVYRVFPDGREELVRGVDIEGTPLTALSKVVMAANDYQVFNGVCGAESGWVPVSATSPSILVSQIEVARQEQTRARPPLLPPPTLATASSSASGAL